VKSYRNPEIKDAYMQRIREIVNGEVIVPEIKYGGERDEKIHASDCDKHLCPLAPAYARIISPLPALSDNAVMRFVRGYAVERMLARNGHHVVVDNIHMGIDDLHPDFGVVEIKSTAQSSGTFDPIQSCPYWISRGMTYCIGCEVNTMHIVGYFVVGTMNDFTVWGIKEKPADVGYTPVALDAWTIEFTKEELHNHWTYILNRADILKRIFETKDIYLMPESEIKENLPMQIRHKKSGDVKDYWQCKDCRFTICCHYFDSVVLPILAEQS